MKITKLCPAENYDILLKNLKFQDPFIMCNISHIENRFKSDEDGSITNAHYVVMRNGTSHILDKTYDLNSATTVVEYESVSKHNNNGRPCISYSMPISVTEVVADTLAMYVKEISYSSHRYSNNTKLQIRDIYITEKLYQASKPLYTLVCLLPITIEAHDDMVIDYTTKGSSYDWYDTLVIKKITKGKSTVTKELPRNTLPSTLYAATANIATSSSKLEESILKTLLATDINFFDRLPYNTLTEHDRNSKQIYKCSFDNFIATINKQVKSKLAGTPVIYQYEVEYHTGECNSASIDKTYITGNWKVDIRYLANVKKGKTFDLRDLSVFQLNKVCRIAICYQKSDTAMLTFAPSNPSCISEFDKQYFDTSDGTSLMDIIEEFNIDPTNISEVDISAIMMRYATTSAEEINKTRKSYRSW